MTGCQGELASTEFNVVIIDEDGKEIINDTLKSHPNGFIDLWLPRNKNYEVEIEFDGKSVTDKISTFSGDYTCITTMQLI